MTKILPLVSLCIGLSLAAGSAIAAWSVTDEASPTGIRIALQALKTVNFYGANGELYQSYGVTDGGKLSSVPADPTYSGYTFDGWATEDTNYTKYAGDLANQTFSEDTNYYARFASYGYKTSSGEAAHLSNSKGVNNVSIGSNTTLQLGTYILGKASALENATGNVTISNAGNYAFVCGTNGSSWDSSRAGTIGNWSLQKYYTVTKSDKWIGKTLFAKVSKSESVYTNVLTEQVEGNVFSFYGDYDATKVEFKSIYSDSDTQDHILDGDTNVEYIFGPYTLNNSSDYSLGTIDYYLCGTFNSWSQSNEYKFTIDSEDSNIYRLANVRLEAGDELKVNNNAGKWLTNVSSDSGYYSVLEDGNISVNKSGVYNVTLYEHSDQHNHIGLSAVTLDTTFRYVYEVPSGKALFVPGSYHGDFTIDDTVKMSAVAGQANTYELVAQLAPGDYNFKFVLADSNGSNVQWDLFNKYNRGVSAGGTASDTYLINYTVSTSDSWAFDGGIKLFVWYEGESGTASGWKEVSYTPKSSSVTISIPKTATKFLLVRCVSTTTTPNWDVKSGDGAGRIYNKTPDTNCNTGTSSYNVSFVNYP